MVAAGSDGPATPDPKHIDRDIAALVRSISELAIVVISPALDSTFGRDRTGMGDSCSDGMQFATGHRDDAGRSRSRTSTLVGEATGLLTGILVGVLVGVLVGLLVGVLVGVIVGVLVRPYFVDSRHEIEIWRIWSPR